MHDGARIETLGKILVQLLALSFTFAAPTESGKVWKLKLERSGIYELVFQYRSLKSDQNRTMLVNGRELGIGFSITDERKNRGWENMRRRVVLVKGDNAISLPGDWTDLEVRSLKLASGPLHLPISVSPRDSTYFKTDPPQDFSFKIEKNFRQLSTVSWGQIRLPFSEQPIEGPTDASLVIIAGERMAQIKPGPQVLRLKFADGSRYDLKVAVQIESGFRKSTLNIVTFDVRHGSATLLFLPSGKTALIDSGDETAAREVVMPFLRQTGLKKLDYYFVTHDHGDHLGGKDQIIQEFDVGQVYDKKSFRKGQVLPDFEGTTLTVLNAFGDGWEGDENSNSLSLRFAWKGFVYVNGGDIYGQNQDRILAERPDLVPATVYLANHHFHGSLSPAYLRTVDPTLFIVSANEAVYARGAFAQRFKFEVEPYLLKRGKRYRETLLTCDTGHVVIRVEDGKHWTYQTFASWPRHLSFFRSDAKP